MLASTKRIFLVLLCAASAFIALKTNAASAPRNLMIQVRINANNAQNGQGADIRSDDAALRGGVYGSQHSGSNSSVQQVMVIEGAQALVNVGQSIVVPMHQILISPVGIVVSDSVLIRDLGTGFYVKPSINSNRVFLEISAYQDTQNASPLDVNTMRISTTIVGKLGEWIALGSSSQQDGDGGNYSRRSGVSDRQIWLKVDAGP